MNLEVVTDGRFDQGWELLMALEAKRFPVKAAFWSPVGEEREWRLYIASPLVDQEGPLKAYQSIQSVLSGLKPSNGGRTPSLALSDISVIGLESDLFKQVKSKAPWAIRSAAKKLIPDFEDLSIMDGGLIYKLNS